MTIIDVDVALFRTAQGRVGALVDRCPHRRMRLSCGSVRGEQLVCPYHGYAFAPDGAGESASTPRMRVSADAFEAVERHGAIWIRSAGAATAFPTVDRDGFHPTGVLTHEVRAPLELVVDNFCEVEHTPSTHALFGYPAAALPTVETAVTLADDAIDVVNRGPQKPIPRLVERAFRVRSGDTFVDAWTVRFSPVHIRYHQSWEDPATGAARPDALHLVVFFTPIDRDRTLLVTFPYTSRPAWGRLGLDRLLRPLMMRLVDHEVRLDQRMIERLADLDPELRGMRLSRFDRPLGAHRERIARLYRGRPAPAG